MSIKQKSKQIKEMLKKAGKVRIFMDSDMDGIIAALLFKYFCDHHKTKLKQLMWLEQAFP